MSGHEETRRTPYLVQLRREFDEAFAAPPVPPRPPQEQLLLVSAAGSRYAVPLEHCSGLVRAAGLTALPAREPGFVGLVAVGGAIVPVYDLAARVEGHMATAARHEWLLVTAGARAAFLVDAVDGLAARERVAEATADSIVMIDGVPFRYVSLARIETAVSDSVRRSGASRSVR